MFEGVPLPAALGLQPSDIIDVELFRKLAQPGAMSIKIVSGSVAMSDDGRVHILKGEALADSSRLMALKVILTFSYETPYKERIYRELSAVRRAQHHHILPFIGTLSTDLYTILVSEFMQNGNMMKYIIENPSARKETLIFEVASGIYHLHRMLELVHGDIKCQNVLISAKGHALLADFGLSTTVEPFGDGKTLTEIRGAKTLRFAAPELFTDDAKSPSGKRKSKTMETDVFAFGMFVVQAFTRTSPWPELGDNAVRTAVSAGRTHPRPGNWAEIGFTDPWWQMCLTCFQFKPEERPPMSKIRSRIARILGAEERVDCLTFDQIAPGYSAVEGPGYTVMDTWLLASVQPAQESLQALPPPQRDWPAVLGALKLCPQLVPVQGPRLDRTEEYTTMRRSWLTFQRENDPKFVQEQLETCLARLLFDADVKDGPGKAHLKAIGDIVMVIVGGDRVPNNDRQRKTVLDIGVMRYPDMDYPYVKVYRTEIVACYQPMATQGRLNIVATFGLHWYKPDARSLEKLRNQIVRDQLA